MSTSEYETLRDSEQSLAGFYSTQEYQTCSFQIEDRFVPSIRGPRNKFIKQLETETDTKITVKSPASPLNESETLFEMNVEGNTESCELVKNWFDQRLSHLRANARWEYMLIPAAIATIIFQEKKTMQYEFGVKIIFEENRSQQLGVPLEVYGTHAAGRGFMEHLMSRQQSLLDEQGLCSVMFSRRAESLLERMKATITRKSGSAIRITDEDGKLFVDIQGTGRQRQAARCLLKDILSQIQSTGFETSHSVLLPHLQSNGTVFAHECHLPHSKDHYALDVKPYFDEDDDRVTVNESLDGNALSDFTGNQSKKLFCCISYSTITKQVLFNQRSYSSLITELLNLVTRFFITNRESIYKNVVKVDISMGKQLFVLCGAKPTQFSAPEAFTEVYGRELGEHFAGARFWDKIDDSCVEETQNLLLQTGYKRLESTADRHTLDLYWKCQDRPRFMTRLHLHADGGLNLVKITDEKSKPLVISFLHPMSKLDFRLRLTARQDRLTDDFKLSMKQYLESIQVDMDMNEFKLNVVTDTTLYDDELDQCTLTCVRAKKKTAFYLPEEEKDGDMNLTVGIRQIFQNSYPGKKGPADAPSHEIFMKSQQVQTLLEQYSQCLMTDSHDETGNEVHTRQLIASGLHRLIHHGQKLTEQLSWSRQHH